MKVTRLSYSEIGSYVKYMSARKHRANGKELNTLITSPLSNALKIKKSVRVIPRKTLTHNPSPSILTLRSWALARSLTYSDTTGVNNG